MSSATLKEIGLVHEVASAEQLDARCAAIIDALLKGAPQAQGHAKALIRDIAHASAQERAAASLGMAARLAHLRVLDEAREGFSAFFAKRKPNWR